MRCTAALLALACSAVFAQTPEQQREVQRALIQRDQQSAEFAAQIRGSQSLQELQSLHARQLLEAQRPLSSDPAIATQLLPYQRERMAEERVLRLPPPVVRVPSSEPPLPLPGRPKPGVEPVTPQGFGG
jgi:hypothetical protein